MNEFVYQDQPSEELINGNVILMSPRPNVNHNRVADNILDIFKAHLRGKKCVPFGDGYDLYLSEKELAENQTSFRCSLFDDLTIRLEDVFRDLL